MSYKDFLAKISRRIFGNEIETYGFNEVSESYFRIFRTDAPKQ